VSDLTNANIIDDNHPLSLFLSMLNSAESKRQYPKRLEVFLDYLKLQGYTIEEKVNKFYEFVLENPKVKYCY
jgi:hypothetical protein